MRFFLVPRLGSLLVVRMTLDHCLFEEALDDAIKAREEHKEALKEHKEKIK